MKLEETLLTLQKLMPGDAFLIVTKDDDFGDVRYIDLAYYDGKNLCGSITLKKYKRERKYSLHVNSVRYYGDEKKCILTGTQILNWIKKIDDMKLFKTIDLDDVSSIKLPNSKREIKLTRFRKFVFGKGWYESYGFLPIGKENKLYQTSFLNFQRNSINNLGLLLFAILEKLVYVYLKGDEYIIEREYNRSVHFDNSERITLRKKLNNILYEKFKFEKKHTINANDLDHLIDYIYTVGTFDRLVYMLTIIRVYMPSKEGIIYDAFKRDTLDNTCILKALTPGNARKIIDKTLAFKDSASDTIYYIESLNVVLEICERLKFFTIPTRLELSKNNKTYKKTAERCTKSLKKYSN